MKILSLFALGIASVSAGGAVELSMDNYESAMSGKNSFVKFLAPWVADVDCTADGEELCQKFNVAGYPTIKSFVDGDTEGEDYQGGRDFDSLKAFVEEKLEVKCDIKDPKDCTDKEKGYIEKMKAKSADDIKAQITRLEGMKSGSMKPELKQWLIQRLRILKALGAGSDEL